MNSHHATSIFVLVCCWGGVGRIVWGNHKDYLTLVSLSTMPLQICQCSGSTLENSRNAAALKAISSLVNLNILAEPTQQRPAV